MKKRLYLREIEPFERKEIFRLAVSRNEPASIVRKAKLFKLLIEQPGMNLADAAKEAGFKSPSSSYKCVNDFNYAGLLSLREKPRSGRPLLHPNTDRSKLINLALQKPKDLNLGFPFELWTLRRLQKAFKQSEGIHLSTSTIWQWLSEEGLEWKRQQSWFHHSEKHDPEFVEKRGR